MNKGNGMENNVEMRKIFCDTLIALAGNDPRIVVLNSDSRQISGTKPFEDAFPERIFNVGIAEANMVSVAAGLAASGKKPIVHAFAPFMSRRCFDQIFISLAYARLGAVLIGLSPGIIAEINGGTHQGYEDIALMRTIPGMTIVEPLDGVQLRQMIPDILALNGPVYLRYFRGMVENIYPEEYVFRLGKADTLREGNDITLISSGIMIEFTLKAAEALDSMGIRARVLNMHTIKPLDKEEVIRAARETGAIVTVENHSVIGGLGSAVAETLCEEFPAPMKRLGIQDRFGEVGDMSYLRKCMGIDTGDIVDAALKLVRAKNKGGLS